MTTRRKTDGPASRSWYRTSRVVRDGGRWYFMTREGTAEGPFECEADARQQLEVYVRLAENDLLVPYCSLSMQAG
ncbi:MAG: hypothetical protein H6985_05895 [Pseudomonadales bacterium]|nr:hypothetical protein [Halioglobus sp.]MCP5129099.1 hypothetical protein [Pseudomonadales bacterium]